MTAFLADVFIVGPESITLGGAMPHIVGTSLVAVLLLTRNTWVHVAVLLFWTVDLGFSVFESPW